MYWVLSLRTCWYYFYELVGTIFKTSSIVAEQCSSTCPSLCIGLPNPVPKHSLVHLLTIVHALAVVGVLGGRKYFSLFRCPCTCPILRLLSRHTCSILYYLYLRLHMHHKPKYMHLSNYSLLLTLQPVPESLPVADHGSSAAAKAKAKVRMCNFCYCLSPVQPEQ